MQGVREHYEKMEVFLELDEDSSREVIVAFNECGYNATAIDLLDLVAWLKKNKPELLG